MACSKTEWCLSEGRDERRVKSEVQRVARKWTAGARESCATPVAKSPVSHGQCTHLNRPATHPNCAEANQSCPITE